VKEAHWQKWPQQYYKDRIMKDYKSDIKELAISIKKSNPDISLSDMADHVFHTVRHPYSRRTVYNLCKPQSLNDYEASKDPSLQDKTPAEIIQRDGVSHAEITEDDKNYFFNKTDRVYVIFSPWRSKPLIVPETTHLAILREYSNFDGTEASVNRLCETFGFDRPEMRWYLRVFNHNHDSLPFSDEEMEDNPDSKLVERGLQMRRGAIRRKLQKKEWEETIKYAEIGKNFELQQKIISDSVRMALQDSAPVEFEEVFCNDDEEIIDVIGLYDLHLGKLSSYGKSAESILPYLQDMVDNSNAHECVLVFGGDTFNVDTLNNKTSRDTPQDNDGLPVQVISSGWKEIINILRICSVYKKVNIVIIPGNHDMNVSIHMNASLKEMTNWLSELMPTEMEVVSDGRNLYAMGFGMNMFAFHHGHLYQKGSFSATLLAKYRKLMALSMFRYAFSGHKHHAKTVIELDDGGILKFEHPSPTLPDQWHDDQGYVTSTPSIRMSTFHRKYGHINTQNRNMIGHLEYE
jgi:hypothetical protein